MSLIPLFSPYLWSAATREAMGRQKPYMAYLGEIAKEQNDAIAAFAAEHGAETWMLKLEYLSGGNWRVVRKTPEEMWMNWQSDNHGWEEEPEEDL